MTAGQSHSQRRRMHGAIQPLAEPAEPSWKLIGMAALVFLVTGLAWVASPTF